MVDGYTFEWDEDKARTNARKHGVTFREAQAIWDDPLFVEVHLASETEDRYATIGRVGKNRFLIAIITYRGEAIRIISARWATKKEIDVYDQH